MTRDEAALLAVIKARPDDDLPRLVFADWLEEHAGTVKCDWCRGSGEDRPPVPVELPDGRRMKYVGPLGQCPKCGGSATLPDGRRERAEFVRVQCELARLTPNGWHDITDTAQVDALRRREDVLLVTNRAKWEAKEGLPCLGKDQWHRGFIRDPFVIDGASWLACGDAVLAAHPVRRVTLTTTPGTPPGWEDWPFKLSLAGDNSVWVSDRWPGVAFTLPPEPRRGQVVTLPPDFLTRDYTGEAFQQIRRAGNESAWRANERVLRAFLGDTEAS